MSERNRQSSEEMLGGKRRMSVEVGVELHGQDAYDYNR